MVLIGSFLEGVELDSLVDTKEIATHLHKFLVNLKNKHLTVPLFNQGTRSLKVLRTFKPKSVPVPCLHPPKTQRSNKHGCGSCCLLMLREFLSNKPISQSVSARKTSPLSSSKIHSKQKKPFTVGDCTSHRESLLEEIKKLNVCAQLTPLLNEQFE